MVLLYSSVAGMCRKDACPELRIVISGAFNEKLPLTIQTITPVYIVALQLKVAVDPSMALTDEGVETNAAVFYDSKY